MIRKASHSGYWYKRDPEQLSKELDGWLEECQVSNGAVSGGGTSPNVIIVPHAGYDYSGSCSAHAFRQIDPWCVSRVFVFGPSHYTAHRGCLLTKARLYETPFGNLDVDGDVYAQLWRSGHFAEIELDADEEEHSIEMQLPYLAKVMGAKPFSIVPVIVGTVSPKLESVYGQIFARYLLDARNLFIVSSDFCHWGLKFAFTPGVEQAPRIAEFIADLDEQAMKVIASGDATAFRHYLQETKNTICGRNAILILLNAIGSTKKRPSLKFLNYKQSTDCRQPTDSCVCYAAASLYVA